jgi:hypothetical protein
MRRGPFRLRSGVRQTGLRDFAKVDRFKEDMFAGRWDFAGRGRSFIFWRQGSTIYVAEGHHRACAAWEIGKERGDWSLLANLIEHGRQEPGLPPRRDRGRFPTRGLWSRLLAWLGF